MIHDLVVETDVGAELCDWLLALPALHICPRVHDLLQLHIA
jgi:hypothetical protein